jgi:ribosomal protein S1
MHSADAAFEGTVTGVNKGGAIVLVEGLRAFLPGSHLSGVYADDSLVGQKLPLKFLEVSAQDCNRGLRAVRHCKAGGNLNSFPDVFFFLFVCCS